MGPMTLWMDVDENICMRSLRYGEVFGVYPGSKPDPGSDHGIGVALPLMKMC